MPKIETVTHPLGFSYIVPTADFVPGELIVPLGGVKTNAEDPCRLQLSETEFILPPQIAHGCEPTAYIDWDTLVLRALRPIYVAAGAEGKRQDISYHFATSEAKDYPAFRCLCGSAACIGSFSGCLAMSIVDLEGLDNYYQRFSSGLPHPPGDFFSRYVRSLRQSNATK